VQLYGRLPQPLVAAAQIVEASEPIAYTR